MFAVTLHQQDYSDEIMVAVVAFQLEKQPGESLPHEMKSVESAKPVVDVKVRVVVVS
jgi:hypothetical protein